MKRRGSVRGRADAGTGSGPGVERVITLPPHIPCSFSHAVVQPGPLCMRFGPHPTSDAGVRCGAVQRPFLLHRAPNRRAGSKHVPNRTPHRPTPVRSSAEGFRVWCTGFEPVVTVWSRVSRRQKPASQFQTAQLVNFTVIVYYKYKTTTNN